MSRSLNKVSLIGNLTRDPELKYTSQGTAVCTFGLATNRQWTTDSGEKKEDVEFHKIVAWQKLAELCAQLLAKGRKVYLGGRLQTRKWTGQDGVEKTTTEIVISEMIILDSRGATASSGSFDNNAIDKGIEKEALKEKSEVSKSTKSDSPAKSKTSQNSKKTSSTKTDDPTDDDIPF